MEVLKSLYIRHHRHNVFSPHHAFEALGVLYVLYSIFRFQTYIRELKWGKQLKEAYQTEIIAPKIDFFYKTVSLGAIT